MWYLTSESDSRIIYILPNKEVTIGRSVDIQVCDFAITDDQSISRRHATLSISDNCLFMQDLGSRYGTLINNSIKMESDRQEKLKHNDVIKFGKMSSIWKVHEANLVTCTSTLKGENLQNLKECIEKLGGVLKNEWDDSCTYLTMPAITLTIKVVLALAQGSHIVTTEFWTKCLAAVNNHTALPNPDSFTPQVIESTLNKENVSFLPNDQRKMLFEGKTFIFFSRRQLEMYKAVIIKCSAVPLLLSETKMTKSALCEQNVIIIQYNVTNTTHETQAQRNQINEIISYLKNKSKRVVPDAEIGLAVLYCSTNKYCNPYFNFTNEVIKQTPGQNTKPANVLAQESQEPTGQMKNKKDSVVIDETLMSTDGVSSKRKLSEESNEFETNANKKIAMGIISSDASNNESGKRKFSDDTNGTMNPNKKFAVDNDDDMFNFTTKTSSNESGNTEKKLNFSKPQKRKLDSAANDEDELFNFLQDKTNNTANTSKSNIFDINKVSNIKEEKEADDYQPKRINTADEKIDISALRGSKLKELMEMNSNLNTDGSIYKNVVIKKEDPDDLDKKMQDLDLGSIIITIRKDLIKKEPCEFAAPSEESLNGESRNFKKFKKVWPVKMRSTVIPKSSMTIVIPDSLNTEEMTSQSY